MCGIVGIVSSDDVNQQIYDSLLLLQHRGQDSTGIATMENTVFHIHKVKGQVNTAYRTRDMRNLIGKIGLGHVRYATKGSAESVEEAQPFYVNAPYGIVLIHNGNLTNTRDLEKQLFNIDKRHTNSSSDTEMLLNVFATELQEQIHNQELQPDIIFDAVKSLHKRIQGSYASIALISGHGLLAFRDPFGIRPLVIGKRLSSTTYKEEWMVASESLVLENNDYQVVRDVDPGEAVFINLNGEFFSKQCSDNPLLCPCAFEYVYLARPDSIMNGISVYKARLKMGDYLSETISLTIPYFEGWNLVGLPLNVSDPSQEIVFPESLEGTLYSFEGGYSLATALTPGSGYWLMFGWETNTQITGTAINSIEIQLFEGWNLITGISTSVQLENIVDPENLIVTGTVYGFQESYEQVEILYPGKGYWLKSSGDGVIIVED